MSAELLYTMRGDLVETIQRGHVAVVDVRGHLIASSGDPEATSYMRSVAKPLQATMLVQSGAAERFGLTGPLLAICCASHQGEPSHVAAVREVLARVGVPESALQCGVHAPAYTPAAAALWRAGEEPGAVHNNCSGKHAGMLAAARALGAPLEGYLSLDHPVQQGILANVAALAGVPRERIVIGVDGCSVPVHGLPIRAMAYAYAHLADPTRAPAYAPLLAPLLSVVGLIVMGRGLKDLRVETWTTIRKLDGTAATYFSHRDCNPGERAAFEEAFAETVRHIRRTRGVDQ